MTPTNALTLGAPAKLNLTLRVTGRRADGYHDLKSLMVPVSLYDTLEIERLAQSSIFVEAVGSPHVANDESNLCHRAARYFFETTAIQGGARIRVEKKIPVGAGMGGGSSDAAATIMGLTRLYQRPLSAEELEKSAFAVGADVPFFFVESPAWVEGVGEKVQPVTLQETLWLVVIHPGVFLSTASVFSRLTIGLTTPERVHTIMQFNFRGLASALHNDLQPAATVLEPTIGEALHQLEKSGAAAVSMTGSGSAVFGLFATRAQAQQAADALTPNVPEKWRVVVVHTL